MTQTISSVQEYYRSIQNSLSNNSIQDISHKRIKECRQKLSGLGLNKHSLRPEEVKRINELTEVFQLLDQKFEFAIANYILKNEFEEDLKRVLGVGRDEIKQQKEEGEGEERKKEEEGILRNNRGKQRGMREDRRMNPEVGEGEGGKRGEVGEKKHRREPTYREDQIVRKQKLIQDLLRENMRLKEMGREPQTPNQSTSRPQNRSQIEEYTLTNNLLVKQNKEITSKLHQLQEVVKTLVQQTRKEEPKPPGSIIKQESTISKRSDEGVKNIFPVPSFALEKHRSVMFAENEFLDYYLERDQLERKRNVMPQVVFNSNNLKAPQGKVESLREVGEEMVPNIRMVPNSSGPYTYTESARYDTPTPRVQTSHARSTALPAQNLFPILKLQSSVLQPDLRQYILPKQKRASNVSQLQQPSLSQLKMQSSLRESVDYKKPSASEFQNQNISFDTFQSVSSQDSSDHDGYILVESRQNTRIQNTPKITSITKQNLTRNKIAFFKKSLIIIKDEMSLEVGFKRSELNREMDCLRISLYITNKLETQEPVEISYEYDRRSYSISVTYKAEFLKPLSTVQEDISVYYKGREPPTFIIAKVQLEDAVYEFVLPALFFSFKEGMTHLDHNEVKTIVIFPEKQFSSPRFMHTVMPLIHVNEHEEAEYRRGQKPYIAECTLKSKTTLQGVRLEWANGLIKLTCDRGYADMLAWILADVQP